MSPSFQLLFLCLTTLFVVCVESRSKDKHKYETSAPSPLASKANESASASVFYDQRQTGKYNINVNIKDVAIISIDPEQLGVNVGDSGVEGDYYGDDEYYDYDQDDFTVSPIIAMLGGLPTKKPKPTKPPSNITVVSFNSSAIAATLNNTDLPAPNSPNHNATALTSTIASNSSHQASANSNSTQKPSLQSQHLPTLQENEIPVHIVIDGEGDNDDADDDDDDDDNNVALPQPGQMHRQRYRTNGRRPAAHQQKRRRQSAAVRRNNPQPPSTNSRRCARGQKRDENGRCPTATRRVGMQRVMDLLTMLTPNLRA